MVRAAPVLLGIALALAGCSQASTPGETGSTATSTLPPITLSSRGPIETTEPAQEAAALLEVDYGFGMCFGVCQGAITFDGSAFTYAGSDHEGEVLASASGHLTDTGVLRVVRGLDALRDLPAIDPVYGCPDCTDGGSLGLRLRLDGVDYHTVYDWSSGLRSGTVPAEFQELDDVAKEIVSAIGACEASPIIEFDTCTSPG